MTRGRLAFLAISAALVISIVSSGLLGAPAERGAEADSFYKYLSVFSEVLRLVRQSYVEPTDLGGLMAGAMDGTTDALDPFSVFVPKPQLREFIDARAVGRRHSGLQVVKERGVAYVIAAEAGSPGAVAGVERGDILSKVDGLSTRRMPLWDIQMRLAQPLGEKRELEVVRAGESRVMTIELGTYEPVEPTLTVEDEVAVVHIPSFGDGTGARVRELLQRVTDGRLIVDLRSGAGGDAEAAYAVARLFAPGELGQLAGKERTLSRFDNDAQPVWSGDLVVLLDRGCFGPCEILAAVLQQGANATLVGQRTFGHAGRSRMVELESGGALFLTEAYYTGPDGVPLNESLEPEVSVTDRARSFAERDDSVEDLILERGIEVLRQGLQEAA